MGDLKVVKDKDGGNCQVRQMWEGNKSLSFCEVKRVNLHPDEFKVFFENFHEMMPEFNPLAKSLTIIDDADGHPVMKGIVKTPMPL
jgi:hypothetical protein